MSRRKIIQELSAKQRLLEAGKQHFAESGFKGASVRDIAVSAELAPNMINHHFGGKQALFDAVLEQFSTETLAGPVRLIAEPAASQAEFELKFQMFVSETFEIMIQQRQIFQIASKEKGIFLSMSEFREGLTNFAQKAQDDGYLRAAIDVQMVVGFVLDRIGNQVLFASRLAESAEQNVVSDPEYRRHWVKTNVDLLLHGLAEPS